MIKPLDRNNIPYDLLLLADPSREKIDEYLPDSISYIYEVADIIVGIYILIKTSPDTFEIKNIAVHENYQGKGLGKRLINHAIEVVKEKEGTVLEIGTGNSSINQLALYQKCGFRIDSVIKNFFRDNYEEDIWENGIRCIDMIRLRMTL